MIRDYRQGNLEPVHHGTAWVYQNEEAVVKEGSVRSLSHERERAAQEVCKIVFENNLWHLRVPHMRSYSGFVVEERLDGNPNTLFSMARYFSNRDDYAQAALELLELLMHCSIEDLNSGTGPNHAALLVKGGPDPTREVGRYDNLFLLEKGCIGLIDTEDIQKERPKTLQDMIQRLLLVLSFFPFHYESLVLKALEDFPELVHHLQELSQFAKRGAKRHKIVVERHLEFLKEKGISTENLRSEINLDEKARRAVFQEVGSWFFKSQKKDLDETVFNELIKNVLDLLNKHLGQKKLSSEPPHNQGDLLELRTVVWSFKQSQPYELSTAIRYFLNSNLLVFKKLGHNFERIALLEKLFLALQKEGVVRFYRNEYSKTQYRLLVF